MAWLKLYRLNICVSTESWKKGKKGVKAFFLKKSPILFHIQFIMTLGTAQKGAL